MDFGISLSGLNAASADISAISNNIANAGTVGFKSVLTDFAASYLPNVNGSSPDPGGAGVTVEQTTQLFNQGAISTTSNPLDVAIDGTGFFVLDNGNGKLKYTRNGQFQIDSQGYLAASNGLRVKGYGLTPAGAINPGTITDIQLPTTQSAPSPTGNIYGAINLNSNSTTPTDAGLIAGNGFQPTDASMFNNTSSVTVYDKLGTSHTLTNYYVKTTTAPAAPDTGDTVWQVYSYLDGSLITSTSPVSLAFNPSGGLDDVWTGGQPAQKNTALSVLMTSPTDSTFKFTYNFSGSTQFGSSFTINSLSQDGVPSGILTSYAFQKDGTLMGSYSNGKQQPLGQIVLASFPNAPGLARDGDNTWSASSLSGQSFTPVPPGSSGTGYLQGSATEGSNVDLTTALVALISAQRNYQASAQAIKTVDQAMQSLNNL